MTMNCMSLRAVAVGGLALAALTGCATQPRPLYYWGEYQSQQYAYFKKQDTPQAQLAKLDETANKAASQNLPLPPGFNAHLGLLYLQSGQGGKAQMAFQTEKARFPESAAYMDFLLKKPVSSPPVSAKPAAAPPPPQTTPAQKGSVKK